MLWVARHPIVATSAACVGIAAISIATAYVSIWVLKSRPHEIRIADDGREARLITVGGDELHKWDTPVPGGITFAEMVDRPAEFGGGKLAIIGYSASQDNPHPGCLCAFDVDGNRDNPVWKRHIERDDIPPDLLDKGRGPESSDVSWKGSMVADFFPESPGKEILALHHHGSYSQCALRIYDLNGNVLYQIWQDGGISRTHWMAGAGLLVCLGGDEWAKLNHPSYTRMSVPFASVVFAVRPRRGFIENGYLLNTPGGDPLSPA